MQRRHHDARSDAKPANDTAAVKAFLLLGLLVGTAITTRHVDHGASESIGLLIGAVVLACMLQFNTPSPCYPLHASAGRSSYYLSVTPADGVVTAVP